MQSWPEHKPAPGHDPPPQPRGCDRQPQARLRRVGHGLRAVRAKPDWDMAGIVDDTRLRFRVGLDVANGASWPEWKAGTEFEARRAAMLGR